MRPQVWAVCVTVTCQRHTWNMWHSKAWITFHQWPPNTAIVDPWWVYEEGGGVGNRLDMYSESMLENTQRSEVLSLRL